MQLEAASGGIDEEARAMLAKLHGVATPPAPKAEDAARIASMSEVQLNAHLASIENQMSAIEAILSSSSSEEEKGLVGLSATLEDGGLPKDDQE